MNNRTHVARYSIVYPVLRLVVKRVFAGGRIRLGVKAKATFGALVLY